jgi:hypothetical protein
MFISLFFFGNNFAVLAYSFPGEEGCKSLAPIFDRNALINIVSTSIGCFTRRENLSIFV